MKSYARKPVHSLFKLVVMSLMVVSLASCEKRDDDVVEPVSIAYVSVYHASPDAPPVDILMENRQINFYPLQYSRYTGYLNFFSGERNMRVTPSDAANVILDTTFTFVEGEAYSLFYVNQLANFQALLVEDELVLPEAGNAAVRFVHLSPDAQAFDLIRTIEDNGGNTSAIAENHEYLEASDFTIVESGLQSFEVRTAGSENVLLSIPDVNLLSGRVYTIVTRGFQTPPPGNTNNLGAQILINN